MQVLVLNALLGLDMWLLMIFLLNFIIFCLLDALIINYENILAFFLLKVISIFLRILLVLKRSFLLLLCLFVITLVCILCNNSIGLKILWCYQLVSLELGWVLLEVYCVLVHDYFLMFNLYLLIRLLICNILAYSLLIIVFCFMIVCL